MVPYHTDGADNTMVLRHQGQGDLASFVFLLLHIAMVVPYLNFSPPSLCFSFPHTLSEHLLIVPGW